MPDFFCPKKRTAVSLGRPFFFCTYNRKISPEPHPHRKKTENPQTENLEMAGIGVIFPEHEHDRKDLI